MRGRIGKYNDRVSVNPFNHETTYVDGTGEGFEFDGVYYKTHPLYRNVGVSEAGAINRRPTKGKNRTRHNPITNEYITTYSTGRGTRIPRNRVIDGVWGEAHYASSYGMIITKSAARRHPVHPVFVDQYCGVYTDTQKDDLIFHEAVPVDDRDRLSLPGRPTWRTVVWEAFHQQEVPENHTVVYADTQRGNKRNADWLIAVPIGLQRAHARLWDRNKFGDVWVQEPGTTSAVRNVPLEYICLKNNWSPWVALELCEPAAAFVDFGFQHLDEDMLVINREKIQKLRE